MVSCRTVYLYFRKGIFLFFRKTFLTLAFLLEASQLFTVRASVYFAFLVRFQSRHSNASTSTVADRRQYGAFLFFKALLYLAIFGYSQSCLSCAYLKLKGLPPLGRLTVDPLLATIAAKYSAANVFFLTGLGLCSVSFFNVDYGLSLGLDTYLTRLIYQVICENPKVFCTLNTHLPKVPPISDFLLHPVKSFTQIRRLMAQLWNPTRRLTFVQSRREGFSYLSKQTRTRLVFLTFICEQALSGAALALVFIFGLVVILMMILLCRDVSLSFAIALFVDTLLLALISWHTLVFIYFAIHVFLLFTFLTRSHLKEVNHNLAMLLFQLKKNRVSSGNHRLSRQLNGSRLLSQQLNAFFSDHTSLATIQATFNEKMVSPFFFVAFFSALLFQVVQVNNLFLEDLQWEEKYFCLLVSIAETVVALQTIRLLISWTDSLYSSASLLFQSQGILHQTANHFKYPTTVSSQLKLMTYIERLCAEKKARFTVGPLGSISNRSLYKFFFAYSGFFLYITSLMRRD